MAEQDVAIGDDAPAAELGKQYLAGARYFNEPRLFLPQKLGNDYLGFKKSFKVTHDLTATEQYQVAASSANPGQLQKYEAVFSTRNVVGTGVMAATCYGAYDEFRIRGVRVSFHSANYMDMDSVHVDHYVWYPSNHAEWDAESGTELTNIQQLLSVKGNGENIKKLGSRPDAGFTLTWVPQVVGTDESMMSVVYQDVPCPWMPTTEANKDTLLRGPVFIWRRPYDAVDNKVVATYNVDYTCIIEFRNLDTNKI